ncbi:MAG TPA: MqnA/MqnD/SBP family protein [Thermoanaerobaculia bacterium]|nr:MqnA/MqnD/SBP family protein [Thermoanaerobaculia bacterium]
MTRISLAHSPDADDAFMFFALAKNLIDTGDFEFVHTLKDIQSLNLEARDECYDVTAISWAAYPEIADRYAILSSGASIGDGYGPLVVSREPIDPSRLSDYTVAIPGLNTSAFVALKLFSPSVETITMPFDEIQEAVADGSVPAGLLIHEGQLTFRDDGLRKIIDLGAWWKETTTLPLPLGGNVIRRALGDELMREISRVLRESIEYSLSHRNEALDYAMQYGRKLDKERADRFVGMYVNELTVDYGDRGRLAVRTFLDRAGDAGLVGRIASYDFY